MSVACRAVALMPVRLGPEVGRSNACRTRARLSSLDFIAAIAAGAPGAVLCSVSSGSLSQSNENWGMPFSQSKSVSAFVVHASRSAGWADGGNAPSVLTIEVIASCGSDSPAKISWPSRESRCRSNKRPTVFAVAITLSPPCARTSSAIVGAPIYFPPLISSAFRTTPTFSTSIDFLGLSSGR